MSSEFQPMHRSNLNQSSNLQKKLFQRNFGANQSEGAKPVFGASPTDNMMSPCSQKLNAHKNRFFTSSKPTKLNFSNLEN